MKADIHPQYKDVVFQDQQTGENFITKSTIEAKDSITIDGQEYGLIKIEVSSKSHPFYTGKNIFLDTAGRVEKFNKKYAKKK
jgi:large subunit ribosomal protein L31